MDGENIQQEPASAEEQVSITAETSPKEETRPAETPTLTEEKVRQLIAEATGKAVEQAREQGKRELQSSQDRNKAEQTRLERRARLAEGQVGAALTHLRSADPEVANEFELTQLRAERDGRLTLEQEEELARQQDEFNVKFHTNLNQFITNLGVDPKDARIDWATDAQDYLEAQQRILTSATVIQKENTQKVQASWDSRLKALEAQVNAEGKEANSVETTTSQGVVVGSDAEFVKNFAEDKLPLTKANVERYQKLLQQS